MTSRSYPSRHKAQQEEEDAAALKLGPGTSYCALISPSLISRLSLFPHLICRIQQRGLSSDFGGQVSAREQGQGCTRHGVRRSPAIQSFNHLVDINSPSFLLECTTRLWNTSRHLQSSTLPIRPRPSESKGYLDHLFPAAIAGT
jgi:hypothetical protein